MPRVVPRAAEEDVVATPRGEAVVTGTALQEHGVSEACAQVVVAFIAEQLVIAVGGGGTEAVDPWPATELVVSAVPVRLRVVAWVEHGIVAVPCAHQVIASTWCDLVRTGQRDYDVGSCGPYQTVITLGPGDRRILTETGGDVLGSG